MTKSPSPKKRAKKPNLTKTLREAAYAWKPSWEPSPKKQGKKRVVKAYALIGDDFFAVSKYRTRSSRVYVDMDNRFCLLENLKVVPCEIHYTLPTQP